MSSSPSTSESPGPSLLETMMVDALERTVDEASGRVRLTLNVSHFATGALFAGTDDVPKAELMRIIRGEAQRKNLLKRAMY
jgi:hypothetical protein